MPAVSQTVGRSTGEAAIAAARLIDKCVEDALAALQASESQALAEQRQQVGDAWRALLARRKAWGERFPDLLQAAFNADMAGAAQPETPDTSANASDFMSLTLVDDTEIARKIESTRLAQQLASMLERPLAELDPLMSSALGLDGIQPQRNPLRPAVYAQVLRDMMEADQPEPEWTTLWLRSMVQPLAKGLEELYREQAKLLAQAQVHAADYGVLSAPNKPVAAAPRLGNGAPAAGTSAGWSGAAPAAPAAAATEAPRRAPQLRNIDRARLQHFLASDEPQAHEPLDADFHEAARAELRALEERVDDRSYDREAVQQHKGLPVVERPPRHVGTDSPLPQETWGAYGMARERSLVRGRLKTQAREAGQVFGLEAVRILLETIAEDPRLLAPVREGLVALEPSLARLAMVAPRFFSDDAHPGRLLVERVCERSFKYNDEFSPEFQSFLGEVAQTFGRLNDIEQLRTATPFQAALATLQTGWSAQDRLDEEAQHPVLEAVQFAERRQLEAQRLAVTLRERDDLASASPTVQEFLLDTWSLVIAHARLTQPQAGSDPGGRLALVADLLWSVDRNASLHEPARAFALIPRVLLKLREGLATLGQQPAESETFFHQLEQLHRPVLKLLAKQRQRELAPPAPPPVAAIPAGPSRTLEQPWMPPEDLRAAGFEEAQSSSGFAQLPPAQRPTLMPTQPLRDGVVDDLIAALEPGCWVDLYARQQWRRARLVWAADRGTLFMFVSDGGQPHSITRRSIQRLLRERLLRPVEGDAVVPRAIEKLGRPSAPMPLAA
jgi:hypothetical protein